MPDETRLVSEIIKRLDALTVRMEAQERNGIVFIPRFERVETEVGVHRIFLYGNGKQRGVSEMFRESDTDRKELRHKIASDHRILMGAVGLLFMLINPVSAHYLGLFFGWAK
jgi:hypothetical protein